MVRDRILKAAQSHHSSYLQAYFAEKNEDETKLKFDPIELSLYISRRL